MISNFKFQISNSSRGFTLIEVVVVLGLFMLIMGVTVSLFVSIVQHQKRILSQQEMASQSSFAEEHITRLLQNVLPDTAGTCLVQDGTAFKGYEYLLTRVDSVGFYQGITFISSEGVCHELFFDANGVLQESKNGAPAEPLLSSKFVISHLRFLINGDKNVRAVLAGDLARPRITFLLAMKDPSYENSREMIIQTTISPR